MKVKDLIEQLSFADPQLDVVVFLKGNAYALDVESQDVGVSTVDLSGTVLECLCIEINYGS